MVEGVLSAPVPDAAEGGVLELVVSAPDATPRTTPAGIALTRIEISEEMLDLASARATGVAEEGLEPPARGL
jgi:hypothetical protein